MPTEKNVFANPPKGFSFATRYARKTADTIGIFPTKFRNFDVNKLPLEYDVHPHVNRYYFAQEAEKNKWHIDLFAVGEGHGEIVKRGTKAEIRKYMLCFAHADAKLDAVSDKMPFQQGVEESKKVLETCYQRFRLT